MGLPDLISLNLIAMGSSLLFTVATHLMDRVTPGNPAVRAWVWGAGQTSAGLLLFGLRGSLPDLLSVVAGNTLVVTGSALLYAGIRLCLGLPRGLRWDLAAGIALPGLMAGLTYLAPIPAARIALVSLICGAFGFLAARLLLASPSARNDVNRRMLGLIGLACFIGGMILVSRAAIVPLSLFVREYAEMAALFDKLAFGGAIALNLTFTLGFAFIVGSRIERSLTEKQERLRSLNQHLEQRVRERTQALEEQEREFHSLADNVPDTIMRLDPQGRLRYLNRAQELALGRPAGDLLGKTLPELDGDRGQADLAQAIRQVAATGRDAEIESAIANKNGSLSYRKIRIVAEREPDGRLAGILAVGHDITEMRRKDERIHHMAFHDSLTGLANRALMHDRLQHALDRVRREGGRLAVIFIDLDRFKSVNDALGHEIGDLLLQEVARRIERRLRAVDTVARLGGDEFVVIMENLLDAGHCAGLARDLIAQVAQPMELRGHGVEIGASLGIAFHPEDGDDPLELMKRADTAMYAAKAAGRNTYRFFRQEMLDRTSRRLMLEMDMRRSIANSDLELHYQPRVDMTTGRSLGVEALLRWCHPSEGLLPPGDFIPLAEESRLILDIGKWVLDAACRQMAEWQAHGRHLKMAVNVSARQIEAGDLVEYLAELIERHGIRASDLEIELTESAVMTNPEQAAGLLGRLRRLGVTVAVDDFGTGYSSLAYLRRLPIDVLKIDRSFVMAADRDEGDMQIVKMILALGQTLKLTVVAEGIETGQQAELLRSHGCGMAQGYYYSRPLPAAEIADWLDRANDHRC